MNDVGDTGDTSTMVMKLVLVMVDGCEVGVAEAGEAGEACDG